jgi:two-component sensor histidine kinase
MATGRGVDATSDRRRAYWVCQLLGWGLYVVVTVFQIKQVEPSLGASRPFVETLVAASLGIALTHQLRRVANARGWGRLGAGPFAVRLVVAIAIVVVLHVGALALVEMGFYGDRPESPVEVVVFAMMRWSMVFFIWSAIYFGVAVLRERQRAEVEQLELARALQAAELRALKSQLNPHFLFNSLNSVRALISDDPSAAQNAVTQLARTLRYALGTGREDTVTFEHELRIVDDYLGLESLRLAERLRVERAISVDAGAERIPVMLLQVLVENAIKHGIAHLPNGGTLRISAERVDGVFVVRVDNPRPSAPVRDLEAGNGVGLANARERLRLLFGADASLELDLSEPDRATVTARIPQSA